MKLYLTSAAEADFSSILRYYFEIGIYEGDYSLAERLKTELVETFDFIQAFPLATGALQGFEVRKINLRKFPYSVIYKIKNDAIWVLSIYDQRRNPEDLKNYLK
jgi:plasmid stabilization system protein ParE